MVDDTTGGTRTIWEADDGSVTAVVVEAIATLKGVDELRLPPLYDAIDTDALDALFAPSANGTPRREVKVSFTYDSCRVVIEGGETVTVRARERLGEE